MADKDLQGQKGQQGDSDTLSGDQFAGPTSDLGNAPGQRHQQGGMKAGESGRGIDRGSNRAGEQIGDDSGDSQFPGVSGVVEK